MSKEPTSKPKGIGIVNLTSKMKLEHLDIENKMIKK